MRGTGSWEGPARATGEGWNTNASILVPGDLALIGRWFTTEDRQHDTGDVARVGVRREKHVGWGPPRGTASLQKSTRIVTSESRAAQNPRSPKALERQIAGAPELRWQARHNRYRRASRAARDGRRRKRTRQ